MFRSDGVWYRAAESYPEKKMRFARARDVSVSFMLSARALERLYDDDDDGVLGLDYKNLPK